MTKYAEHAKETKEDKKDYGRTWTNQPNWMRTWPTILQRHEILIPETEKFGFQDHKSSLYKSSQIYDSFEIPKEL